MSSRTRIKICGITNRADAETAIALGADALGFNVWSGSKRFVKLENEAAWISELPLFVSKIAVMVNPTIVEAEAVLRFPWIDALQFHGDEDAAFCAHFAKLRAPFIKAISLKNSSASSSSPLAKSSTNALADFQTPRFLLDAFVPGEFGGTGRLIDLPQAAEIVKANPEFSITLSGGLNAENVTEAIRAVQPYAVDVASGVDQKGNPRKKDATQMQAFIEAVQN